MNSRFAVAVHVLTLLARARDEPITSERVATSVNTNPVVIRRILCELVEARLVISRTGAGGGSRLACAPDQISLRDVHRAVGGDALFSLHRQRPNRRCPVGMNIEAILEGVFEEVSVAVEHVLAGITIQEVSLSMARRGGKWKSAPQ